VDETPWTLVSNTAWRSTPMRPTWCGSFRRRERVVVAADLVATVLDHDWRVIARFAGQALTGAKYRAPFGIKDIRTRTWRFLGHS